MGNLSRREREKKTREAGIIEAAEKVFSRKSFDEASMDEIAKEAQFTKRTLYQYFKSKEDLYFALALKIFKSLYSTSVEAMKRGQSSFEKIRLSMTAQYQFFKDFPDATRIMTYIGFIKKIDESDPRRIEWLKFDGEMFSGFASIIEDGKKDGSIRPDIDAAQTAYSMAFLTTGFFHLLSETGRTFTGHFGLNIDDFVNNSLELLLDSIRPK